MQLSATITRGKASRWTAQIRQRLKEGAISSHELEKVIEKLCCSQTCLFGKLARTQLRCLYMKLHAHRSQASLSLRERLTLTWWADVLIKLQHRAPSLNRAPPNFALNTDAATGANRIDALLFQGPTHAPTAMRLAAFAVPNFWRKHFDAKNTIFGLEMLGPLASIFTNRTKMANSTVNLYIDNNNVLTSLVRGTHART